MGQIPVGTRVALVCLLTAAGLWAQQSEPASAASDNAPTAVGSFPRLVRFSGTLPERRGASPAAAGARVSFSIYEEQAGGAALWSEVQDVRHDVQGRYSVLLGAASSDGLPAELFSTAGARWLGVQVEGRSEEARILLVAVPYALKAADADTLGGKPATAFVASEQLKDQVRDEVKSQVTESGSATRTLVGTAPTPQVIAETSPATFTCATSGICVQSTQSGAGGIAFRAVTGSATGTAGIFDNLGGGKILSGRTTSFAEKFYVDSSGNLWAGGSLTANSFSGTSGAAVFGVATAGSGTAYGVRGQSASPSGTGVFGYGTSPTGLTYGLLGSNLSASGTGLSGSASSPTGVTIGVRAVVQSPNGTAAIFDNLGGGKLISARTTGYAERFSVDGGGHLVATATAGTAISGDGGDGIGVSGTGITRGVVGTGPNIGVLGSSANYGVYGNGDNYGVYGTGITGVFGGGTTNGVYGFGTDSGVRGQSDDGKGVYGTSTNGYAVMGSSTAGGTAVYGYTVNGTAGWFNVGDTAGTLLSGRSGVGGDQVFTVMGTGSVGIRAAADPQSSLRVDRAGTENTDNYGLYVSNATTNSSSSIIRAGLRVQSSGTVVTNASHGALVENLTTNATADSARKYGLYIGSTGAFAGLGGTATRNYSLYAATPSGADENYGAYIGGSVGIGVAVPLDMLQVAGDVRIGTSGTNGCLRRFDGATLAGACSSDLRLKTNIQPFAPVLHKLAQLQPVRFNWRAAEFPAYHFGDGRISGLIAQEVERFFPELVAEDERGYKTVNYSDLPVLMLQGIRELKSENDGLKSAVETLTEHLNTLMARVAELEKAQK